MYSGVREELMPGFSPVDLFHVPVEENFKRFPLLSQTQVFDVTLHPGTCVFVPAWWWAQSITISQSEVDAHDQNRKLTSDDDSLTVLMEFSPHSMLFHTINTGIELDLILADENSDESEYRLNTIHGKITRD